MQNNRPKLYCVNFQESYLFNACFIDDRYLPGRRYCMDLFGFLLYIHLKSSVSLAEPVRFSHLLIHCSGAHKSVLYLLDKIQSRAIRCINNPNLTKSLQSLSYSRLVGNLSIFTDTFKGIALRRSGILFLLLRGVSGPPAAQFTHTFFKFHRLLHELYLINHYSSQ